MVQQLAYSESKPVQQSGADIAELQQSAYRLNQAGSSTGLLQDIVNMGSTNPQVPSSDSLASFMLRGSQNNVQFVDSFGNIAPSSRLPLNDAHFQQGQGQGHNFQEQQHYRSYDQRPGPSVMGSVGSDTYNQAPGRGIRHMQSFQDSTDDQDQYQGGNDESTWVAEAGHAGLQESPDASSDEKSQR